MRAERPAQQPPVPQQPARLKPGRLQPGAALRQAIAAVSPFVAQGRITAACGPILRASLPGAALGDRVLITEASGGSAKGALFAQVVGFDRQTVVLSPLGPADDIRPGAPVKVAAARSRLLCGTFMLGTVLDSSGQVVWRHPASPPPVHNESSWVSLLPQPPSPLDRLPVDRIFPTAIRAIDAFLTLGEGQRLAIFAEPGVGKSTLISMLARFSGADVNIIGLIGERGREIAEFVAHTLDTDSARRTIIVAAGSAEPPLARINASLCAAAIAEFFRDRGCRVLLEIDSLTRLFRAYRELGLAAGEPPVRRGYPPSVFANLPRLIERAGRTASGSVTAVYTALLSSDIDEDPMVEEVKGLTDGHLVLSRKMAERNVYPAIDILASISRAASRVLSKQALRAASLLRTEMARIEEQKELFAVSEGNFDQRQTVLAREHELHAFLAQNTEEPIAFEQTIGSLLELVPAAER